MTATETFPTTEHGVVNCCHGAIRSYDHLGAVFSWEPPLVLSYRRAALDVEAKDQPSVAEMSARHGLTEAEFLRRWVTTEAIAKVLDVPILDYLKKHGLPDQATEAWQQEAAGVWVRALQHPTHWAAVAVLL
jgi:hypothetical protein